MNHYTAIPIEYYWIIVSDDEIRNGDTFFSFLSWTIQPIDEWTENIYQLKVYKKVIGAYPELNGLPVLDVPYEWSEGNVLMANSRIDYGFNKGEQVAFLVGYNKAKEKYRFTEEDMCEFVGYVADYYADIHSKVIPNSELLKRFTKPKQYSVEIEQDCTLVGLGLEETCKPKITEGKIKIASWKEI